MLPWNLIDEIAAQLAYVAGVGRRLIVPIPPRRSSIDSPGDAVRRRNRDVRTDGVGAAP